MEVHLAVYDLSNGMARNLSSQFLGPNHTIEMIPHTALLCFGKEYFYGGGIQAVDPYVFRSMRGIQPCQIEMLGITETSQDEFEAWCRNSHSKFNPNSYDLLNRNCNNFSHEAALYGLKLTRGVPEWILSVPQQFLASPMGQMIRPMLEQMQITQNAPFQAATSFTPANTTATTTSSLAQSRPVTPDNPWMNSGSQKSEACAEAKPIADASPLSQKASSSTSILNKFTNPMISKDTQSIQLCFKKLSPHLISSESNKNGVSQEALTELGKALEGKPRNVSNETVAVTLSNLWQLLKEDTKCANASFALLLLRLLVLKYPNDSRECMSWLSQKMIPPAEDNVWKNAMSRSLAWCVLSNYWASDTGVTVVIPPNTAAVVDSAIKDWHHESVQVRQAASTYLYNYVLSQQEQQQTEEENIDDTTVSILCSVLERLTEEIDPTTRLRQLVLCGRLVFPHNQEVNDVAQELVQDLGFVGMLAEICCEEEASSSDGKDCQQLASELVGKFVT